MSCQRYRSLTLTGGAMGYIVVSDCDIPGHTHLFFMLTLFNIIRLMFTEAFNSTPSK